MCWQCKRGLTERTWARGLIEPLFDNEVSFQLKQRFEEVITQIKAPHATRRRMRKYWTDWDDAAQPTLGRRPLSIPTDDDDDDDVSVNTIWWCTSAQQDSPQSPSQQNLIAQVVCSDECLRLLWSR